MEKPHTKETLIDCLKYLDTQLDKPLTVVAVGGSALSLLGLKVRTKDIDIMLLDCDDDLVLQVSEILEHKYSPVDIWANYRMLLHKDGKIYYQNLPTDCCNIKPELETAFEHITLKLLHPLDILITKINRASEADLKDMASILESYKFTREQIKDRFEAYLKGYEGNKYHMRQNLASILDILL